MEIGPSEPLALISAVGEEIGVGVGVGVAPQSKLEVHMSEQAEVVLATLVQVVPTQDKCVPETVPPAQEPSHWIVSPLVQGLPSLQELP